MKKILFAFCFLLFTFSGKATHISYTDITYKWISGLTYEFTLTLYRDCGGVAAPSSVIISVCSPSSGSAPSMNFPQVSGTGLPVFPVCSYPLSVCVGGTDEGFEKYIYKGTYTFPSAKNDWTITHNYCCREAIITNVPGPLALGTGIKFMMDNLNYPGNSSPTFNEEPVLFACCNQSFSYNQSATDIDGDSLYYSLYNPYTDNTSCPGGTAISYSAGFSYLQPITSSPLVSMNSATGYLTMYPTVCSEVSIMGVKVEEYRSGILIGSILRDNMVIVTNQAALNVENLNFNITDSVFPNPAMDKVFVKSEKGGQFILYNVIGESMLEGTIEKEDEIDISNLPSGIYFLEFKSEKDIFTKKIIKE